MQRRCEKTIIVPYEFMGQVIGKGGARIDRLAKIHRCELKLVREEALANGDTPLNIKSLNESRDDVLRVEHDVQEIVSLIVTECYS
jgi:predicted PilT family ATPase